jgi:hypothetical protein
MTNDRRTPRRPELPGLPSKSATNPSAAVAPHVSARSSRPQFLESLVPILGGLALIAGAWEASADHIRVFSSPYPLWILLAVNGGIALVAGVVSIFIVEPNAPTADVPDVVLVPRKEWESLQRRLRASGREPRRPDGVGPDRSPFEPARVVPAVGASRVSDNGPTRYDPAPQRPARSGRTLPGGPLGRERALLELQCIAEGALFASQNLGSAELSKLVDDASPDLTRIAAILDVAGSELESPSELLLRLLRLHAFMQVLPSGGRFTVESTRRLAIRLKGKISREDPPHDSGGATVLVGPDPDEVDAISRELAPERDGPSRDSVTRRRPSLGQTTAASPS